MFFAAFDKIEVYYRPMVFITILNCLLSKLAIVVVDCIIFYYIDWGYQLLIAGIETFVLEVIVFVLLIWEGRRLKSTIMSDTGEPSYMQINPRMFDNSKLMSAVPGGYTNETKGGPTNRMDTYEGRYKLQENYGTIMHMSKVGIVAGETNARRK